MIFPSGYYFAALVSAIAWPVALLSVASVLDNPWNVCIRRSQEVGHHLAEVLLARQQGQRPVTLLGFSLGARVIYHCLLHMAQRPHSQGPPPSLFPQFLALTSEEPSYLMLDFRKVR